jgi:chitinase
VTLTDLGPTHVSLAWSSTDNSQWPVVYSVAKDGVARMTSSITSGTFQLLQPGTTYSFTVQARDNALNWSPITTLSVTTPLVDQSDVTPPTTPNVWADLYFDGSRELQVTWTPSTDNVTAQVAIVYHVFVNGVLDNSSVGKPQASVYGVAGDNVITVIAVDTNGNRSAPGEFRLHIPF